MHFVDRHDAGKQLAQALLFYKKSNTVIYALPRGGVVLGVEIAQALRAPLDLVISRKIGHPANPEYALCAASEEGDLLCGKHADSARDTEWLTREVRKQQEEAIRRRHTYMGTTDRISAHAKQAILVDDGIATGLTIRSALQTLRKQTPQQLIVAVPVAPHEIISALRKEADAVVVLEDASTFLGAVGAYYDDFSQVSDNEVISLMQQFRT